MLTIKHNKIGKIFVALLSIVLILTVGTSNTFSYLTSKTPSFINTFLSGLKSDSDLIINKEVIHPFGDGYRIPDQLRFLFDVELGDRYANKEVQTSLGKVQANNQGVITVSSPANGNVRILNILDGTRVKVKEHPSTGFCADGGAERIITLTSGENHITYRNRYEPEMVKNINVNVNGEKKLDGREWQDGDEFKIQLEYKKVGEQQWEEVGVKTIAYNPLNEDFYKFCFTDLIKEMKFTDFGEYAFRVSEIEGTIPGISYDTVVSYFDVVVGDHDMDGFLEIQSVQGYQNANVTYDKDTNNYDVHVIVNNIYAPKGSATAKINIDKKIQSNCGIEPSLAGYRFELYDENETLVATSNVTSAAGETLIELVYEAKDVGTTNKYYVVEKHAGETIDGMIYDYHKHPITVSIKDCLDGTISATIYSNSEEMEYASNECFVSFVNHYDPTDAYVTIDGKKELVGRSMKDGEFYFDLYDQNKNIIQSVANDESGLFHFEPIQYDKVGVYHYTVKENCSFKQQGILYDERNYTIVVTVNDEQGKLKAETSILDELGNPAEIVFKNHYHAEATSVKVKGCKILKGMDLKEAMFQFHLYPADERYRGKETPIKTATNDTSGTFNFTIDCIQPGTYYYVVKEDTSLKQDGITFDYSMYGVKVDVWDDGDGTLNASYRLSKVGGSEVETMVFENRYSKPIKPITPSKPVKPNIDETGTGDCTAMTMYVSLLVASGFVISSLLRYRNSE